MDEKIRILAILAAVALALVSLDFLVVILTQIVGKIGIGEKIGETPEDTVEEREAIADLARRIDEGHDWTEFDAKYEGAEPREEGEADREAVADLSRRIDQGQDWAEFDRKYGLEVEPGEKDRDEGASVDKTDADDREGPNAHEIREGSEKEPERGGQEVPHSDQGEYEVEKDKEGEGPEVGGDRDKDVLEKETEPRGEMEGIERPESDREGKEEPEPVDSHEKRLGGDGQADRPAEADRDKGSEGGKERVVSPDDVDEKREPDDLNKNEPKGEGGPKDEEVRHPEPLERPREETFVAQSEAERGREDSAVERGEPVQKEGEKDAPARGADVRAPAERDVETVRPSERIESHEVPKGSIEDREGVRPATLEEREPSEGRAEETPRPPDKRISSDRLDAATREDIVEYVRLSARYREIPSRNELGEKFDVDLSRYYPGGLAEVCRRAGADCSPEDITRKDRLDLEALDRVYRTTAEGARLAYRVPGGREVPTGESLRYTHKVGRYEVVLTDHCAVLMEGDKVLGLYDAATLKKDGRVLLDLDKGMRLEVTEKGRREVMSPEKAGLYMLLGTEGYFAKGRTMELSSKDPEMIQRFGSQIKKAYDGTIHTRLCQDKAITRAFYHSKDAVDGMVNLGPFFDSRRWRVPFEHLTKEGAKEQIISLGDAEGTPEERSVRFASMNFEALIGVKYLLSEYFGVESNVTGPILSRVKIEYWIHEKGYELVGRGKLYDLLRSPQGEVEKVYKVPCYRLGIYGRENLKNFYFNCYPCFTIRRKREALERILRSYKRRSFEEIEEKILGILEKATEPPTGKDIAKTSGIDYTTVLRHLHGLYEKEIVDYSRGKGSSHLWRLRRED